MKKRILILDSNYPNEKNLYGDVFVHARARYYKEDFEVQVLGWDNSKSSFEFVYEGIPVKSFSTKDLLVKNIYNYKPDIILIHFVEGWMLSGFIANVVCPVIIWVHGIEALGWYRRLFNFGKIKQFGLYVAYNTLQMIRLRKLIRYSNESNKVFFVFVSDWMKRITQTDSQKKILNYYLIPNPIDTNIFAYQPKSEAHAGKILLIRSFESKKYANDLAIDAIIELSKKPFFYNLEIEIYGKGKYFASLTNKIQGFKNVKIHNYYLENKSIPDVHRKFGIFLCPTRQDAQGVSMCEAMSSGLVPISSNNTAIPEFLQEGKTGFMTKSAKDIADRIEYLYKNPKKFLQMSNNAATEIQQLTGHSIVMRKEIKLIYDHISNYINKFSLEPEKGNK